MLYTSTTIVQEATPRIYLEDTSARKKRMFQALKARKLVNHWLCYLYFLGKQSLVLLSLYLLKADYTLVHFYFSPLVYVNVNSFANQFYYNQ